VKITPGHIEPPGEHVVLVGPIQGSVTLDDGEVKHRRKAPARCVSVAGAFVPIPQLLDGVIRER
jgi:hypothetical protein